MVLELYLVAKHNTSIYPGSDGEIGLGDYDPSVTRYLGRVRTGQTMIDRPYPIHNSNTRWGVVVVLDWSDFDGRT